MADYRFLRVPETMKWVILDPNRAKRPNVGHKAEQVCPFCIGREKNELELYRVGGEKYDRNWRVRVVTNKFPFVPIHEIVIHSPDHHKNFEELPLGHIETVLQTYRERYQANRKAGQVYIFHNRGIGAGESLPHPHTQIAMIPHDISVDIPPLDLNIYKNKDQKHIPRFKNIGIKLFKSFNRDNNDKQNIKIEFIETGNFLIFCPGSSQWSDEVWVAPMRNSTTFGEINDKEIGDLAFCLQRIIGILDMRHGHEFPFNFYIYPGKNWYLRIIPRFKVLGGFEVGTGIIVNSQDPKDTFEFIKEHFFEPDLYKIRIAQQADYWKSV